MMHVHIVTGFVKSTLLYMHMGPSSFFSASNKMPELQWFFVKFYRIFVDIVCNIKFVYERFDHLPILLSLQLLLDLLADWSCTYLQVI